MGCSTGTIQILRGFESDFKANNPVLKLGEMSYSLDKANHLKIGDGSTPWKDLDTYACVAQECPMPCTLSFRVYEKSNFRITEQELELPASSGFPAFDSKIFVYPDKKVLIKATNNLENGVSTSPSGRLFGVIEELNGNKSNFLIGEEFNDFPAKEGKLFVGISGDDYSSYGGYYLVSYEEEELCFPCVDCATDRGSGGNRYPFVTTTPSPGTGPSTTIPPTTAAPTTAAPTTAAPTTAAPTTAAPTTSPPGTTIPPNANDCVFEVQGGTWFKINDNCQGDCECPNPTLNASNYANGYRTNTACVTPASVTCSVGFEVDPLTCECVPEETYNPPEPPTIPVPCNDAGLPTVSGYAFYFNSESTETFGDTTLTSACYGGHSCNRAIFTPILVLDPDGANIEISGTPDINLNNGGVGQDYTHSGSRRSLFTFQDPRLTWDSLSTNVNQLLLQCKYSNCHTGITWVVLTVTPDGGSENVIFSDCVVPGTLSEQNVNLYCSGCDGVNTPAALDNLRNSNDMWVTYGDHINGNGILDSGNDWSSEPQIDITKNATESYSLGLDADYFDYKPPYSEAYFTNNPDVSGTYTYRFHETVTVSDADAYELPTYKHYLYNRFIVCSGHILWDFTDIAATGLNFEGSAFQATHFGARPSDMCYSSGTQSEEASTQQSLDANVLYEGDLSSGIFCIDDYWFRYHDRSKHLCRDCEKPYYQRVWTVQLDFLEPNNGIGLNLPIDKYNALSVKIGEVDSVDFSPEFLSGIPTFYTPPWAD